MDPITQELIEYREKKAEAEFENWLASLSHDEIIGVRDKIAASQLLPKIKKVMNDRRHYGNKARAAQIAEGVLKNKTAFVRTLNMSSDGEGAWLSQFEGTPFHTQAIALLEQEAVLEKERYRADQQQQDLYQESRARRDEIALAKNDLVLAMAKSKAVPEQEKIAAKLYLNGDEIKHKIVADLLEDLKKRKG